MTLRILQITDCHLFADPQATLKRICTQERLSAVLSAMREELKRADRLIITGDLTHDERQETYAALREQLADWLPILRMVPGNHDDRLKMREMFPSLIEFAGERNVFAEVVGNWQLIGLDSQIPGSLGGKLGSPQLAWLETRLAATANEPAALFLHHPPVHVGSPWLDRIGLEDSAALWEVLGRFPQVKLICAGHVHQELAFAEGTTLVLATPSTGIQFRPQTEKLVVDEVPPGFRILELEDSGEVRTTVVRVTVKTEQPAADDRENAGPGSVDKHAI